MTGLMGDLERLGMIRLSEWAGMSGWVCVGGSVWMGLYGWVCVGRSVWMGVCGECVGALKCVGLFGGTEWVILSECGSGFLSWWV